MMRPDPKKTAEVFIWMPASTKLNPKALGEEESAVYLSCIMFKRREILYPEKVDYKPGTAAILLRITLYAIQRMIQRGYALAEDGEISYSELLSCLGYIYSGAIEQYEVAPTLPAENRVKK